MKTYPLSITRDYVSKWGVVEAVRELIQNALDSERPFEYQFEECQDYTYCLSIMSAGVTLGPETLLLGKTTKQDDPLAIGQFGEGFKLAMLVLTRMGRTTVVRNGRFDWRPAFEHSAVFGDEILTVHELLTDRPHDDLTFEIYGLTQEDVDAISASCLLMQSSTGSKIVTSTGEILLDRPGTLYVGNLYACSTRLHHGYNINSNVVKLDRDRQTVSSWDLDYAVMQMWIESKNWAHVAEMIDTEAPDVEAARYISLPSELKAACYERFQLANPDSLVALTDQERERLERSTRGSVVRVNAGMYAAISNYEVYSHRPRTLEMTPNAVLTTFRESYLSELSKELHVLEAFDRIVDASQHWKNA